MAGFCVLDPTQFHPNFRVFPLDPIAYVGVNVSKCPKLFDREIIFEVYQPMSRMDRHKLVVKIE